MLHHIKNVAAAIQFIETHLTDKLDLESVAAAVHYSKYHLHRIFVSTVGMTVHDYAQRRRLTEAAKLLVFSNRPIIEIALLAGYESQQAFTDTFRAMYKKAPGQFRDEGEFYPLQLRYELHASPTLIAGEIDWQNDIVPATERDIPAWMALVRMVVDGFPHLNEAEYLRALHRQIQEKRALIMKDGEVAIGILAFCPETGSIDFFGIHPQYRDCGIAQAFVQRVLDELTEQTPVSITTFREGDKADPGQRAVIQSLGFAEAELLTEFGYPTQRFILRKEQTEGDGDV